MSTANDYKTKINNLKASINADNKKLQSLQRSGGSQAEINTLQNNIKNNQAALTATTAEYDEYTHKQQEPESSGISAITEGITKSISDTVDGVTNTVSSAMDTVNNIKDQIADKVSSVTDAVASVGDKLSSMVSSAKDKLTSLFSSDAKSDEQVKSLATKDNDKGPKETQTKVKTISPNEHSAMAQPVAYVTRPITTVVDNTKSAPAEDKKDGLPKIGPLADKAKKLGKDASWTNVIKDVTKDIKSGISKVSAFVSDVKSKVNAVKQTVAGTVRGVVNTVGSAVASVTSSVLSFTTPIVQGVSDVIKCGKSLTGELASVLPGPLGAYVSAKSDAFFNKVSTKVANSKLFQIQNALTKLNAVSESGNFADFVGMALLSQAGKKYPMLTDAFGMDLTHMFGNNTIASLNGFNKLITQFCPQVAELLPTDAVNYSENKLLYDSLLGALASNGCNQLLLQLATCEAADRLYYDESSTKMLQKAAQEVLAKGDVDTYKAIMSRIGTNNVEDPSLALAALSANVSKEDAVKVGQPYNDLVSMFGYTPDNLYCNAELGEIDGCKVYDGSKVALATVNDTTLVKHVLDPSEANSIELTRALYASANA